MINLNQITFFDGAGTLDTGGNAYWYTRNSNYIPVCQSAVKSVKSVVKLCIMRRYKVSTANDSAINLH